jgi:hypothetical protein
MKIGLPRYEVRWDTTTKRWGVFDIFYNDFCYGLESSLKDEAERRAETHNLSYERALQEGTLL